jgi:response regulator RpfG family c-di-GMP phosphodiesterase
MKKLLLIVEDNAEIANIIKDFLSDIFDDIFIADTVDQAQENLASNHFALMTLDINLHGRNGSEVMKFLIDSPDNENKNTPVVLISGMMTPAFIEKNKSRFAGVLMKPFDLAVLKQIAEDALKGKLHQQNPIQINDFAELPYLKCPMPFTIFELDQKVAEVISQVRRDNNLKKLFTNLKIKRSPESYMGTHIAMLINISVGISMKMEWNTEKTLAKLVYAAYLHDMALVDHEELAQISSYEELLKYKKKMTEDEYKLVFQHANIAATTLADIKEIPPDVTTMIRQHHERPRRNGFPSKISHQQIIPLSTIFIVAHDLTDYIIDTPQWTLQDYVKEARDKFSGIHFNKALIALESLI